MNLTFDKFDARRQCYVDVIDQDTSEKVGVITSDGVGFSGGGGISVNLFGGKYRGRFKKYDECVGFVRGVQAVLKHITHHLTDLSYPPDQRAAA